MHVYNNYKSVASVWSVEGEKLEHFLSEELKQFPERKASRPDVGFFGFVLGFFPQFVRFLTRGYTPQRSHRSHTAVKLLSPGHIYAGVITKARWQVSDRWWIDGLCPWVWTAPTWLVHQKHNNTVGGCCRVTHTSSKPKDTGASGGLFWNWMVITHETRKKNATLNVHTVFPPREKHTAVSAINILAHKYFWQQVPSSGSTSVNACWARKRRTFQMLLPSIHSIVFIWEKRWWGEP